MDSGGVSTTMISTLVPFVDALLPATPGSPHLDRYGNHHRQMGFGFKHVRITW